MTKTATKSKPKIKEVKVNDLVQIKEGIYWKGQHLGKKTGLVTKIEGYTYVKINGIDEEIKFLNYEFEIVAPIEEVDFDQMLGNFDQWFEKLFDTTIDDD